MADTQTAPKKCKYCGFEQVPTHHAAGCRRPSKPVAVPTPTEPSGATELPEPQRYAVGEVIAGGGYSGTMFEEEDGDYVRYDDYAALKAKYEAAQRETECVEAVVTAYSEALKFHMDRCDALLREITEHKKHCHALRSELRGESENTYGR